MPEHFAAMAMAFFWGEQRVVDGEMSVVDVETALWKLTNILEHQDLTQLFGAFDTAKDEKMTFLFIA